MINPKAMRTKSIFTTIDGERRKTFQFTLYPGLVLSAVCVASETPSHAESSIRKLNSYKHTVLHGKPNVNTQKNRKQIFSMFNKVQYRAAIGL